ncbi:MAG TPA: DUF1499 domain-containing protein [Gammaproteobacteria bacterium]|nr:DUF1499 domain-containing protein [Gammaproteobacteria bacterium]
MNNRRILVLLVVFAVNGCSTILTPTFGVRQGQLASCPLQRDCVSSQDSDPKLHIAPLVYASTRDQARSDLLIAITVVGQGRIVSNHRNYIRIEYPITDKTETTSEYYYQPENAVDDVEFYLEPDQHIIEMRSIARLGLFDIGANRARLEQIRSAFAELQQRHN